MSNDKLVKTKSILMVWPWPIVFLGLLLPLTIEHPPTSRSILQVLLLGYPLLDLLDRLLDVLDPLLDRLYPLLDRRDALLMVLKQVILNCSLLIQTVLIVKILVMIFFFYPIERETMILFLLSRSFNILYEFLKLCLFQKCSNHRS